MLIADVQHAGGEGDDFLLAIVHDMRVHLRKAVTRAQRLAHPQSSLPPELQEHVEEILAAGRETDVLLSRLAKYAVAGRDPSDKPASSIEIMFHSALSRLAHKNAAAEIDSRHYHLSADIQAPPSFEIVLLELLDNALKFRSGPVKITLTVEEFSEKNVFGVADTGIGFEPQYGEKIMRPLERLHPASVYPGSGLGLPICQRMVGAWGGKLWAESKLGGGSTFWFSVPT